MIKLILNHLLNNKNKIFIGVYFLILILIFIITLPFGESYNEILLNITYHRLLYNDILKELVKLLFAVFTLLITMDHSQGYINNVTTYKSRREIIIYKLVIYSYILLINMFIIIILYFTILNIFSLDILIDLEFVKFTVYLFIDNIIILLFMLLIVRSNNKILSYLILIMYYIFNIIHVGEGLVYLFYIIPIYSYEYLNYSNTNYYVLVYIVCLITLNIYKYLKEDFIDN